MKLTNYELINFCNPRLIERFGRNTCLGKHALSPEAIARAPKIDGERPVWSIITLNRALDYTIHGTGKTPERALMCAGLEGWIEDAKKKLKRS